MSDKYPVHKPSEFPH